MDQSPAIDYRLLVDNLTTAILLVDSNLNIFTSIHLVRRCLISVYYVLPDSR